MTFNKSNLHAAISANNAHDVANLLSRGEDATLADSASGATYLHLAASVGDCDWRIVAALLDRVDVTRRDARGATALDCATPAGGSVISEHVMALLASGEREKLGEMVQRGWGVWVGCWPLQVTRDPIALQYLRADCCETSVSTDTRSYTLRQNGCNKRQTWHYCIQILTGRIFGTRFLRQYLCHLILVYLLCWLATSSMTSRLSRLLRNPSVTPSTCQRHPAATSS